MDAYNLRLSCIISSARATEKDLLEQQRIFDLRAEFSIRDDDDLEMEYQMFVQDFELGEIVGLEGLNDFTIDFSPKMQTIEDYNRLYAVNDDSEVTGRLDVKLRVDNTIMGQYKPYDSCDLVEGDQVKVVSRLEFEDFNYDDVDEIHFMTVQDFKEKRFDPVGVMRTATIHGTHPQEHELVSYASISMRDKLIIGYYNGEGEFVYTRAKGPDLEHNETFVEVSEDLGKFSVGPYHYPSFPFALKCLWMSVGAKRFVRRVENIDLNFKALVKSTARKAGINVLEGIPEVEPPYVDLHYGDDRLRFIDKIDLEPFNCDIYENPSGWTDIYG